MCVLTVSILSITCTCIICFYVNHWIIIDPNLLVNPYTNLTLGSTTTITCRAMDSNLSDISVYWIDSNNMNEHNPLYFSPVALSDNNTRYTCFIHIHQNPDSCIQQNKSITITIKSNEYMYMISLNRDCSICFSFRYICWYDNNISNNIYYWNTWNNCMWNKFEYRNWSRHIIIISGMVS